MPLPSSGAISLNNVNQELGRASPYNQQISLNDTVVRSLFGVASGQIAMSDGYGKFLSKVVASGGTEITNGDYKIHIFTTSGTFSVTSVNDGLAELNVFAVGGGFNGTAGDFAFEDFDGKPGGTGGAGGSYYLSPSLQFGSYFAGGGNYTVTVGAAGSNSTLANLGALFTSSTGVQGIAGGTGGTAGAGAQYDSDNDVCSVGGGSTPGGAGGNGTSNSWTGTTYYYSAGGGGGGGGASGDGDTLVCASSSGGSAGNASAGSGGAGGSAPYTVGNNGVAGSSANYNRGGGGGGGGGAGSTHGDATLINGGTAGAGGTGIVMIRYRFR